MDNTCPQTIRVRKVFSTIRGIIPETQMAETLKLPQTEYLTIRFQPIRMFPHHYFTLNKRHIYLNA